jgi:iron complex transport system permease protein
MTAEAAPRGIAIAADGRRVLATRVLLGTAVLLALAALLSLSVGPTGITLASLPRVIAAWLGGASDAATAREQLVLSTFVCRARSSPSSWAHASRLPAP